MEKKIEIIPFLAGIVEENTQLYRIDFAHDEKLLRAAMLESRQEYRTFLWMSRCSGTQCVLEREVFMQESGAHFIWTYYANQAKEIKAYRVTVAPGQPDNAVLGIIQPLKYGEQVERVKRNAIRIQTVDLRFKDGTICSMPHEVFKKQCRALVDKHGTLEHIDYHPEKENELSAVLWVERAITKASSKHSRNPKKPPAR
ncbi:MAG: hypothetical protein K1W21_05855 [Oscillospiraceae bacterium]